MSTITTVTVARIQRLEEFILADFDTYKLELADLIVWYDDACAVGKLTEYVATLEEVIELGSDWGRP
jgi:hypothetical protein